MLVFLAIAISHILRNHIVKTFDILLLLKNDDFLFYLKKVKSQ